MRSLILTAIATLAVVGTAHAQSASSSYGQIVGVMRDSASGAPLIRGRACGTFAAIGRPGSAMRCGTTGDGGHYRIDSIPAGTFTISATCPDAVTLNTRELVSRDLTIAEGATVDWNVDVPATGCDQRPMERTRGRFRGLFYNPDFETSWFFPDGRTDQRPGADFTHTVRSPDALPSVKGTPYGFGCVRVTFAGTMHGPFNRTGYAFDVDTVIAARAVPEEECFKIVERFLPEVRSLHPGRGGR